jgi:hypothetical protein
MRRLVARLCVEQKERALLLPEWTDSVFGKRRHRRSDPVTGKSVTLNPPLLNRHPSESWGIRVARDTRAAGRSQLSLG